MLTGRSYPVTMEGDYIKLERAYLEAEKPEPGAPLMARFEGDITRKPAMEGDTLIPTVSVRRFIGVWPVNVARGGEQGQPAHNYFQTIAFLIRQAALITLNQHGTKVQ